ncbi:ribbon-helix-helix domain-containing protein [Novosphingobium bradum]|uniref:Ribbon-helix-helix domain-containing protein n=1 Tax=Novosphingobium bradum TaxID=1737444 RepID=A0ABV7IPU2_9SPHN
MRILADLPDDDIRWLDERAAELGKSRAALLREAVSAYRAAERDWLEQGFGLWTRFGRGADGNAYERALRAEWAAQPQLGQPESGDPA